MSDNLYLFANNNGVQAENNGSYRLYGMKIEGTDIQEDGKVNYADYLIYSVGKVAFKTNIMYKTETTVEYALMEDLTESTGLNTVFQTCGSENNYVANDILIGGDNKALEYYVNTNLTPNEQGVYSYTFTKNFNNTRALVLGCGITSWTGVRAIKYMKFYQSGKLVAYLRPAFDTQGNPCVYDDVTKTYLYNQLTGTFSCKKILRDFQPVLDSNNIPCLLDKINNKFYYNKGTGSFTYVGIQTPKDGYTEIEYIESNGTQYIDTGVVLNSNTDIDMTCRAVSNGGYILNGLQLDTTYKFNGTDTTVQPNLTASTGATLTMGSQNIAYLTEAEIAQAVLNGWTIQ